MTIRQAQQQLVAIRIATALPSGSDQFLRLLRSQMPAPHSDFRLLVL
jgi:hypothetical protein